MRWVVDGKLSDVQACVERARDIFGEEFEVDGPIENKGSSSYGLSHVRLGDIGRIKITSLPSDQTELYGYDPELPSPRWLVDYLLGNIVYDQLTRRLQALLKGYVRQIEQGIFQASSDQLYHWHFTGKQVDHTFDHEGLGDPEELKRAEDDFEQWRIKLREMRRQEFEGILGVIEGEIHSTGLTIRKPGGRQVTTIPGIGGTKPWELIPAHGSNREVVRLWCDGLEGPQIADRLSLSPGRVQNIITGMRKKYPDAHIPYHGKRKS